MENFNLTIPFVLMSICCCISINFYYLSKNHIIQIILQLLSMLLISINQNELSLYLIVICLGLSQSDKKFNEVLNYSISSLLVLIVYNLNILEDFSDGIFLVLSLILCLFFRAKNTYRVLCLILFMSAISDVPAIPQYMLCGLLVLLSTFDSKIKNFKKTISLVVFVISSLIFKEPTSINILALALFMINVVINFNSKTTDVEACY